MSTHLPATFFPYTISAGITFVTVILLLLGVFGKMDTTCRSTVLVNYTSDKTTDPDAATTSTRFRTIVSIMFFVFNVFYAGIEVGYAGLLTTFAVKHLGWPKQHGNNATILLQLSNCIGRSTISNALLNA